MVFIFFHLTLFPPQFSITIPLCAISKGNRVQIEYFIQNAFPKISDCPWMVDKWLCDNDVFKVQDKLLCVYTYIFRCKDASADFIIFILIVLCFIPRSTSNKIYWENITCITHSRVVTRVCCCNRKHFFFIRTPSLQ